MATIALESKIKEVDNKIPDYSGLVKKTNYDAKILEYQGKYFTISDYNKFTRFNKHTRCKDKTKIIS